MWQRYKNYVGCRRGCGQIIWKSDHISINFTTWQSLHTIFMTNSWSLYTNILWMHVNSINLFYIFIEYWSSRCVKNIIINSMTIWYYITLRWKLLRCKIEANNALTNKLQSFSSTTETFVLINKVIVDILIFWFIKIYVNFFLH